MPDVTLAQYALVAILAMFASVIGGLSGYGTGLLLPPILIPIIGAEAVVPVMGVTALFTNGSRLAAFREHVNARRALLVTCCALPTCMLGAYGYTRLSGPWVAVLIGSMLIILVPVRHVITRLRGHLSSHGLGAAGAGYGLLVGSTTGSGVVLLSILLASGLDGRAVIATDAAISLILGCVKTGVFQTAGSLSRSSWIMAGVIGVAVLPGAFVAKRLALQLSLRAHTLFLDGAVIVGGAVLILQGLADLGVNS